MTSHSSAFAFPASRPVVADEHNDDDNVRQQHRKDQEAHILHECVWSLLGLCGQDYLQFDNNNNNAQLPLTLTPRMMDAAEDLTTNLLPTLQATSLLGTGALDALQVCGQAGWYYRRLQRAIQWHSATRNNSVVARALARALAQEAQAYETVLETLLHPEDNSLSTIHLRQMVMALRTPMQRLESLAMIADGLLIMMTESSSSSTEMTDPASGGQQHSPSGSPDAAPILQALVLHSQHGDTRHAACMQSLLKAAAKPWWHMLHQWITQGLLEDPAHEFFVVPHPATTTNNVWHDHYRLDRTKVPVGVLEERLVEPAFTVGKGVNYIRHCLGNWDWTMEDDDDNDDDDQDPVDSFPSQLTAATHTVNDHILRCLFQDYSLVQHLFALKQFLLLGQGDFVSALLEGLHAQFIDNNNAGGAFSTGMVRHSMAALVDHALQTSHAVENVDTHIQERLHVKLLPIVDDNETDHTASSTTTVWDVFTLEYTVPDPVLAIVYPAAMADYQRLFRSLFDLVKVEFLLNSTWRQSAVLQHALQKTAHRLQQNQTSSVAYATATLLLRKSSMVRQSMMHFVLSFKSYLQFEILQGGWSRLVRQLMAAQTLDQVIAAHDAYLKGICHQSLLLTTNKEPSSSASSSGSSNLLGDLATQLGELLHLANEFSLFQQRLFGEAQQAADRAEWKRKDAEERSKGGQWGFISNSQEEESFFGLAETSCIQNVDRLSTAFHEHMVQLLKELDKVVNGGPPMGDYDVNAAAAITTPTDAPIMRSNISAAPDEQDDHQDLGSLRFLMVQLDHNNYYGSHQVA